MIKENAILEEVVVIITTRNRINELLITIKKCLEIGLHQHQLFITDDASTDGTSEAVRQSFPGIRLQVNTVQGGLLYNRNYMMKNSSERFILSLDDDSNLMSRTDLEEALYLLDSREDYGVFGFIPVERVNLTQLSKKLSNEVFPCKWYIGCGHIIKRSTLDKIGLYREEFVFYGEETDFAIRCFKVGMFVISKRNLIVHHRVDYKKRIKEFEGANSKAETNNQWRNELDMANKVTRILLHYPGIVIPYYITKAILGYYYVSAIKHKWQASYWKALRRVLKRKSFIRKEREPLTLKEFFVYNGLEDLKAYF